MPIGIIVVSWLSRYVGRTETEEEPKTVKEHVKTICNESETVGEEPVSQLYKHEDKVND